MAEGDAAVGGRLRARLPADRAAAQRAAEALVRDNRFTIAVVFPLVGAVTLVASAQSWVGPPLRFNPLLVLFGTLVMRTPLLVGLAPLVGRRAGALLAGLTAFAYGIEVVGVTTGWPYGEFVYLVDLGPMLFGKVPLGLPVFYIPLVVNAYLLTLLVLEDAAERRAVRLLATMATVVAVDLVLDPGAVAIGFWAYDAGGAYYGVPASNYLGWLLSGAVAVGALDVAFERTALRERLRRCEFMLDDLVSFVVLWGAINAVYGNWAAVAAAVAMGLGLVRSERFDTQLWRTAWVPGR
jgi:putative membrane protein